jgi:hypothetical protein
VPESAHRVGQQTNEIKKEKAGETTWSDFLFLGSTDPVAKERLFLERFTCFQQGKSCEYARLATHLPFAVEPSRKSKHHFA